MAASDAPDRSKEEIPVIIICGPTASGKSGLALEMAQKYDAEILSADSRQIFRQLKIGTDRLDKNQQQGITHHLMGSADLGERFTAFDFVREAERVIEEASDRGQQIIICGGTGLYVRALVDGIFEIPDDDMTYRQDLLDMVAREGPNFVHRMLSEVDPKEAANIHPRNYIKVVRALEIYHITGRPKSEMVDETKPRNENFVYLYLILLPDRDRLYERINQRVDEMIDIGLIDEAREVLGSIHGESLRNSKIVGYRELIDFFDGNISQAEAINLIKRNTRRYAKRQYTWFRAAPKRKILPSFGSESAEVTADLVENFLKSCNS